MKITIQPISQTEAVALESFNLDFEELAFTIK